MRILIDINHPAHVHFFKYFVWEAEKLGHKILVTATRKDIAFRLLDEYGIKYENLGSYGTSIYSKLANLPLKDLATLKVARRFDPDVMLGVASHRICHTAFLLGKKAYVFDDTEHAALEILLYKPFATKIFTPDCFYKELGPKQVRYPGYHELAYLHPARFAPDPGLLKEAGLAEGEAFSIVRFVSWDASHDLGQRGIAMALKIRAVEALAQYGRVLITSEKVLPAELEQYRYSISPGKIHHFIAQAALVFGESATMCSEAAVLGTHAIFCDFNGRGYTDEEENRYGLVFNFRLDEESVKRAIGRAEELLSDPDLRIKGQEKRARLLKDKIDVTGYMLEQVLN